MILTIFSLLSFTSFSFADEAAYLYDNAGRLVRVVKGNERVLYQYDEVGNLLSIIRENSASQTSPPVLQGIDPDIFLIGANHNVLIAGQNLLTTTSITSDNPSIMIKNLVALDTGMSAVFSIAGSALPGQVNITVTTSYGSASTPINLHKANISPEAMTLFVTSTADMSVSLTPSASKSLKAAIVNKDPAMIKTGASLLIPSGGNATFTVKALKEGTSTVAVGSAEATVYVLGDASLIQVAPVSVSIGPVPAIP